MTGSEDSGTCAVCGTNRPLPDLLVLTNRARPWIRRFVCRPGPERMPSCFRLASDRAEVESVESAAPRVPS